MGCDTLIENERRASLVRIIENNGEFTIDLVTTHNTEDLTSTSKAEKLQISHIRIAMVSYDVTVQSSECLPTSPANILPALPRCLVRQHSHIPAQRLNETLNT